MCRAWNNDHWARSPTTGLSESNIFYSNNICITKFIKYVNTKFRTPLLTLEIIILRSRTDKVGILTASLNMIMWTCEFVTLDNKISIEEAKWKKSQSYLKYSDLIQL